MYRLLLLATALIVYGSLYPWNCDFARSDTNPLWVLLWSVLRDKKRLAAGACLLASAIVLRELSPFHFARTPQPFSWIPFAATFESECPSATVVLLRKAFEYGATAWVFRAIGFSYARAAAAVAGSLAIFEAIQRYLPGRVPEITDSVLALAMAFALWRLSDFPSRRGLG